MPEPAVPIWGDSVYRITMRQTKACLPSSAAAAELSRQRSAPRLTSDSLPIRRQVRFHRDLPETTVWAYDGVLPGPTIHATANQPITVEWVNALAHENGTIRSVHAFADMPTSCVHGPNMWGPTPRTVVHVHGVHSSQVRPGRVR